MSQKSNGDERICDHKTASTLAASSLAQYFKQHHWKIISFFPNSICANCPKPKSKK